MKAVIAIDSLKGSLSSLEAGDAIRAGILLADKDAQVIVRPLADGGEGTAEALTLGLNGEFRDVSVSDPLGRRIICRYGIVRETKTAVMEIAAAAGLTLLKEQERCPLKATTYGVGEMIADAIYAGCRHFIIGLGGSATNDGGAGMLQALGFGLLDASGRQAERGAAGLKEICRITDEEVLPELRECDFRIACDVVSPLCGENGASVVFSPQKGATAAMAAAMDRWMASYAETVRAHVPDADPERPGTGAAGGLGFAFMTFLKARLESGAGIVLQETKLEEYIRDADLVVTGEGRLDAQTVMGKAPAGVAHLAKKYGRPVIAFSGAVTDDAVLCNKEGIDAFFPIIRKIISLDEATDKEHARVNMMMTSEQVFRLIHTILNLAESPVKK